jgi:hypothetical protein
MRLVCVMALFVHAGAYAERWTREEFLAFRQMIEVTPVRTAELSRTAVTQKILPVSPGYDQGGSGLCWAFATLNAVETDYLVGNLGTSIALSRAAMQTLNMEDRYLRKIMGIENNVWEGGTPVNAIDIVRRSGLFAFADYHPAPVNEPWRDPFALLTLGMRPQISEMYRDLDQVYGALPAQTHGVDGAVAAPTEVAKKVLADSVWTAYGAPWSGTAPGWSTHYDPDARSGTLAKFVTESQFGALVYLSLQAGHALTIDWGGHEEELYGAAFDATDTPTLFYIKGSYGPNYTYQADATALKRMVGLTTLTIDLP